MSTPVRITGLTAGDDPVLAADGWVRRTVTDVRRADELSRLYTDIGFEVLVKPVDDSNYEEDCTGCATGQSAVVLYIRSAG